MFGQATAAEFDVSVFDTYHFGEIIGSGAFGQVRACWPVGGEDDNSRAVKIIDVRSTPPHITPAHESEILSLINHPYIVRMHEVFEDEHLLFLIQERIFGGELFAAFADPQTSLTEGSIALVGTQLLQALRFLHDRKIIHRDVKAENVLLRSKPSDSQEWHAKLIDFGLALRMEVTSAFETCSKPANMSTQDIVCGTLYYCAPEVFLNCYGPAVDIWALGVLMYLALFGVFPFYDRDQDVVESMICNTALEPEWQPVSTKETAHYEVSEPATEFLASLLEKIHEERPSAEVALKDAWLRKGRSLRHGAPISKKYASAVMPGHDLDESEPEIPMAVRLKAQRAAAKPEVSPATEQRRTDALVALKTKTVVSGTSKIRAPPPLRPGNQLGSRLQVIPRRNAREDAVDIDATMAFWTRIEAVTASATKELTSNHVQRT